MPIPKDVLPISPSAFKYLGKSADSDDLETQINGSAKYGIDHKVPGMLYASIERCLVPGGKLKSYDASAVLRMPGVKQVIPLEGSTWNAYDYYPSGVAVLASDTWTAQEARKKIKIIWEEGNNRQQNSKKIDTILSDRLKKPGKIGYEIGEAEKKVKEADEVMEAYYSTPFWSHSPMEPMNTIAYYQEDHCEFWTPCHAQSRLLTAVKQITGFENHQIKINTTLMGGSFGRRLLVDYAIEALLLSKASQKAVQVLNSRIDETKCGHFMTATKYLLRAAIKDKALSGLGIRSSGLSIRTQREPQLLKNGIDDAWVDDLKRYPYAFPNAKYEQHLVSEIQIPVLWWRGTFGNTNCFVMESWIDEIAHKLEIDPIDYRLSLLKDNTYVKDIENEAPADVSLMKRVLTTARQQTQWSVPLPSNTGKGIAVSYSFFESYAALVAEVEVDKKKKLNIKKITCVVDCGQVLNPDMVRAQIEGGIIFALSAMLKGAIHFQDGKVVENSYRDYPILRYQDCPLIEVILLDSDRPVGGVGELGNMVTFAAVCNAIFTASGIRIRNLPLKGQLNI